MTNAEILPEINKIFQEVLDNDQLLITLTTIADDIAEWDSLTHIQLIVTIEKHYNIRFSSREIHNWNNVGEMIDSINQKLA